MGYIESEIREVAKLLNIPIIALDSDESSEFHKLLAKEYALTRFAIPYWEQLNTSISSHDMDGWKKIGSILADGKLLLLFDELEEKSVFEFDNSDDLVRVLSESTGFVFYVSPLDLSELICFNDHDMLMVFKAADQPFANVPPT
ncbi:hypothetical protein [Deinococcus reticulitermitis]|uniref:hypothetical protein n=1 Tax=Deinococcus reticulitermitis TaxID=856736 RepID=UPI001160C524|nr:hypothetical protein [Deinococcus reticulitermitis]